MLPEIANLHERMATGGSWLDYRDEISNLHKRATLQCEFIILMEAFANLRKVGSSAFDPETWPKLEKAAAMEYQLFLLREATDTGSVLNPMLMAYVTEREVEAGRLDTASDARTSAINGWQNFGDSSDVENPPSRPGNWLAAGLAIGGIGLWLFGVNEPVSLGRPGPTIIVRRRGPVGRTVGWVESQA